MSTASPPLPTRPLPGIPTVLLLAGLAGCAAGGGSVTADATLEGRSWEVVELRGMTPPAWEGAPYLRIDSSEGQVMGDTGCNSFNGPYRADGVRLVMGPLAVTRRACPGEVGVFEDQMLEAIRATTLYRIRRVELFLYPDSDSPAHMRLETGVEPGDR